MSFKIIAVRPLKNCKKRFLKNLEKNHIYKFYNDYDFTLLTQSDDVKNITFKPTIPVGFFNVDREIQLNAAGEMKNVPIEINISAIVGKNGSGKSAVSELFMLALFIISNKFGFIIKENFLDTENPEEEEKFDNDLPELLDGVSVEFFYSLYNDIYKIKIDKNEILYQKAVGKNNNFRFYPNKNINITAKDELPAFFYSMVINYSFYGLNSRQIGMWIKAFFHKNDGYQMPLVINPYREEGIMDINTENILARSRVLANILSIKDYKNINSKSPIKDIELTFNFEKDYLCFKDKTLRFSDYFIEQFRSNILKPLYSKMFNEQYQYPVIDDEIKKYAELYLIQKLITIPSRYTIFKPYDLRFSVIKDRTDNFKFPIIKTKKYIDELIMDQSHITLKVRQTLNFLRKNIFNFHEIDNKVILNLKSIEKDIALNTEEDWFTEAMDYLPPPFFISRIQFQDGSFFDTLSSGEKQKIYSLNSVVYHLKNIDSVHKNALNRARGIIAYDTINLLFDEIELYYHPEFQKSIILELLTLIKSAQYVYINNINMIFLTHSPFILSDIPNQNILYLKNQEKIEELDRPQKSFGANITDLLAHSFFITDGLLGDFAKEKISITLNWLKIKANDWHQLKNAGKGTEAIKFEINSELVLIFDDPIKEYEYHKQIIEIIDEPIVKNKLKSMYVDYVTEDTYYLEEEIKKAEEKLKELKKRKKI